MLLLAWDEDEDPPLLLLPLPEVVVGCWLLLPPLPQEVTEEGLSAPLLLPLLTLPSESLPPKAEAAALGPRRPCLSPVCVGWWGCVRACG